MILEKKTFANSMLYAKLKYFSDLGLRLTDDNIVIFWHAGAHMAAPASFIILALIYNVPCVHVA